MNNCLHVVMIDVTNLKQYKTFLLFTTLMVFALYLFLGPPLLIFLPDIMYKTFSALLLSSFFLVRIYFREVMWYSGTLISIKKKGFAVTSSSSNN